jgi:nitrate/nitrite transporter NarK
VRRFIKKSKNAWSVLIVMASSPCFMVWMMFAVVGIPPEKTLA